MNISGKLFLVAKILRIKSNLDLEKYFEVDKKNTFKYF